MPFLREKFIFDDLTFQTRWIFEWYREAGWSESLTSIYSSEAMRKSGFASGPNWPKKTLLALLSFQTRESAGSFTDELSFTITV
jgi:hypothetical protein